MKRKIMEELPSRGALTSIDNFLFQPGINNEFTVSVGIGRIKKSSKPGTCEWQFGYRSRKKPDVFIIARADLVGTEVRDYFIRTCYCPTEPGLLSSFRAETLDPFFELCAREKLELR